MCASKIIPLKFNELKSMLSKFYPIYRYVTGPAKIGYVGSQNLDIFQTFVTHNFLLQYGIATRFSEIVRNLTGSPIHLTEPKYYISVLRNVS